jgi:hypothetical protein
MKPAELKYNERSWAIDIISYINNYVDSDSIIKRAGGEFSISGGLIGALIVLLFTFIVSV